MSAVLDELSVPEGTYRITGVICSVSYQRRKGFGPLGAGRHLPHATMRVSDDRGFEVFGTLPRNVERELIPLLYARRDAYANVAELVYGLGVEGNGLRVEFVADVARTQRDASFGIFRRPRRARLLYV